MWLNSDQGSYSLTPLDMKILREAGISISEILSITPKHPGLPPLWSRVPYLMLQCSHYPDAGLFWKAYRELDTLLKHSDDHYSSAYIPKSNGSTRALMVPDFELCSHQRFILKHILNLLPVSEYAFAYCPGRGLTDLARPHIGQETLIHLDIQDFFPSITEQMVFEALCTETDYPKSVAGFLSRLCCYRKRLPQGACTSPALSNLCFKECDGEIAAFAAANHLSYSRYSDDLYLSGREVDAPFVIAGVKAILSRHGFRLRSDKTRVLRKHHAQRVTAITVNERMQVSRAYRRKLRQELYYFRKYAEQSTGALAAESYSGYLHHLLGKVTFVLYIDPGNREFGRAKVLLEQTLSDL